MDKTFLDETLWYYRSHIASGTRTLDYAVRVLAENPENGLTEPQARELLTLPLEKYDAMGLAGFKSWGGKPYPRPKGEGDR